MMIRMTPSSSSADIVTLYRVERALGGVAVDMQAPRDFSGGRPAALDADVGLTETADALRDRIGDNQ